MQDHDACHTAVAPSKSVPARPFDSDGAIPACVMVSALASNPTRLVPETYPSFDHQDRARS